MSLYKKIIGLCYTNYVQPVGRTQNTKGEIYINYLSAGMTNPPLKVFVLGVNSPFMVSVGRAAPHWPTRPPPARTLCRPPAILSHIPSIWYQLSAPHNRCLLSTRVNRGDGRVMKQDCGKSFEATGKTQWKEISQVGRWSTVFYEKKGSTVNLYWLSV